MRNITIDSRDSSSVSRSFESKIVSGHKKLLLAAFFTLFLFFVLNLYHSYINDNGKSKAINIVNSENSATNLLPPSSSPPSPSSSPLFSTIVAATTTTSPGTGTPPSSLSKEEWDQLLEYEKNTIDIFQRSSDAVVNVTNIQLARAWWDMEPMAIPQGAGSGFVWNSEGYIVTNYHVVHGGNIFLISFNKDKKQYKAEVVGVSPRKDIAVLKLNERPSILTPVNIGISKNLLVGQKVIAIGNPFGLDHTTTTGIVSALGRKIDGIGGVKIEGMIQTDASINPGNSGGPLLDSRGRLIGMNTMIFSRTGSSSGVGFAVPVDTINLIVPQLIKHKKEIRPGMGIGLLPDQYKERLGIDKGMVVASVSKSGAAARAGLKGIARDAFGNWKLGDIILSIDGEEVNSFDDIYSILDKHKIGDAVEASVKRNNNSIRKVKIQLIAISD